MGIPYDESKAFYVEQLAGMGYDETTPLYDLQKAYYLSRVGSNSVLVTPGMNLQGAIDVAAARAGLVPVGLYGEDVTGTITFSDVPADGETLWLYDSAASAWVCFWFAATNTAPTYAVWVDTSNCSSAEDAAWALYVAVLSTGQTLWAAGSPDGTTVSYTAGSGETISGYSESASINVAWDGAASATVWKPGGSTSDEVQVIVLAPGTYTGDIVLPSRVNLVGTGTVVIDGTLTAEDDCEIENITVLGAVSAKKYVPSKGGGVSRSYYYNWDTALDRPLPRIKYSSANLFYIIADDARSTGWKTTFTELGSTTPLAYATARRIPICFAPFPKAIGTTGYLTGNELGDFIAATGAEALWHTYSHNAAHTGMPPGVDPDDYEVTNAITALEDAIYPTGKSTWKFPVMSGVWAGVSGYSEPLDVTRPDNQTRRGLLVRRSFIAYRDWNNTSITTDPRGEVISTPYHDTLPIRARLGSTAIQNLSQLTTGAADTSARVVMMEKWLNMLANSKHVAVGIWFHDIVSDSTSPESSENCNVSVFKTIVDFLAAELDTASPRLIPATFTEAHMTYPCAAGEEPNLWLNPSFEYVYGGADGSKTACNINAGQYQQPEFNADGSSDVQIVDDDARTGSQCLYMYRSGDDACFLRYMRVKVTPGETLLLSWWQKNAGGTTGGKLDVTVYRNSTSSSYLAYSNAANSGADWEKRWCRIPVPKDTYSLEFRLAMATANTKLFIDDVFLG